MEEKAKRIARFEFGLTPSERPDSNVWVQHADCTRLTALRTCLVVIQWALAFVRSCSRDIRVHRQTITGAAFVVAA